jgi:RNA polymerase sigma factor (sigma-70 family)
VVQSPRSNSPTEDPSAEVLGTLVENHRRFLSFLERRVGDRALAEDILQEAFVRGLDAVRELRSGESAVSWFYRLLRNAVVDHHRRRAAADRKVAAFAFELERETDAQGELHGAVCQCVKRLSTTLKPEYVEALERVELEGLSVKTYAERIGVSPNAAAVRVFRAREALRKQVTRSCGSCADHGCLDCSCRAKPDGERGGAIDSEPS